jgi:sugar transferase (PEP-CTERM/EpsH1 system associated)
MKIFVILSRVPYPLEKGDKLRAFHQLRELKKKHEIVLCCLNDGRELTDSAKLALDGICNELHIFNLKKWRIFLNLCYSFINGKPFQVMYFYQRPIRKAISKLIAQTKPDKIYCQLIRTAEYAKDEHDYYKVLDYQDAFSKGMSRRKQKAKWPLKEVFGLESKRLIAYENIIFEYFESKTIISEEDRRFIYHPERKDIAIITNGIETDFFHPEFKVPKKYDLVFTGNMSYPPNIETAEYIVNEIMPALRKKRPEATLLLAGSSPHKRVKALEKSKGVTISGWIDDIRSAYASGRIFIAPMQIGTGLQNKLLESMSMEIPSITSPLANRALKAKDNQDLIVRNDVDGYVEAICLLLDDEALSIKIGKAGRLFVKTHFSWEESVRKLEKCFSPS